MSSNKSHHRLRFCTTLLIAVTVITSATAAPFALSHQQVSRQGNAFHTKTDWRVTPSLTLDTVCFLNVLTGDPFYVRYYRDEYARFEPQLTPAARAALAQLKRKIKDEQKNIISAFLALYFSATEDRTLDEMLQTLRDSARMKKTLEQTVYYSKDGWRLYESVREDLRTVLLFLKSIGFEDYWRQNILPQVQRKIAALEKELPAYNVIAEVERRVGFALSSNTITIYMLYFSQPHGIRVTGTRFIADAAYPFKIVLQNAVHEMLHPPYGLDQDKELKKSLNTLRADAFLMDKVEHHNPSFGYNTFESYIEENCVRALDQLIDERFKIAGDARRRWKEEDEGMHVFAVALYSLMKQEKLDEGRESFRDFLVRMIRSGKLKAGGVKKLYDAFYDVSSK
jgi:hypothetical protein